MSKRSFVVIVAVLTLIAVGPGLEASDLIITGVVDGPLSGGLPKAVEFFTTADIPDLSIYGFGSANNGGGSDGEEFTFPVVAVSSGSFIYVATEATGFTSFFGFAPDSTSNAASINGDDAIELFQNGVVVDVFGDINVDGTGQPWEYMDGWTYRNDNTGPDGSTFVLGNWYFSGPNALDGETTNATAATPFPIGTFITTSTPPGPTPPDLLLTEIVVTPTDGEFIEIHNPTAQPIDLSDVYLTDATYSGGGTYYYNIVTGSNAGGGGFGDFHARFPDGASIAPGVYQTISLAGSDDFLAEYGIGPDYELFEDGGAPDAVPDMREALPGSINNQGGLSNSGEVVILYTWDGASDLVADIDYAVWGDKVEAVDKTGVTIDGPDPDSTGSTYLPDTAIASQDTVAPGSHAFGATFQRADLAEGTETQTGGNGLTGSDETSEDLSVTWSIDTAPTPGGAFVPPLPPTVWIINEIHADPASGISGDANRDGVRHFGDDEFVEIINISGAAVDISGWTLADGYSVRHTFPAGTVIEDQCGVVVFGGGSPTGPFGGVVVQTASTEALGLNNGGDTVTLNDGSTDVTVATYGSEGGDNQSLTLDPDLTGAPWTKHSAATGSGGTLFSPGTLVDGSQFGGCPIVVVELREIYEIQGSGPFSPFVGLPVITEDNTVTALRANGFFIQTPAARSDGDPLTSDGIFIFTSSNPTVAVGDQVDVSGIVVEFYDFTEIGGNPLVIVDSTGNALPAPVMLDETLPSGFPAFPPELESLEGMLVTASGVATGPSDRFGDIPVVARTVRSFREKGIEFPGLPGLPVWDGNPEIFELDPDGLDLANVEMFSNQTFDATGPLGFSFGDYQLLPSSLIVGPEPALPIPARDPLPGEFTVASQNLLRFFDTDLDFPIRVEKVSLHIRTVLKAPDILAVQEVDTLTTLQALADQIAADDPGLIYTPYLIEGNDLGGIDVGFLVRDTVMVYDVFQFGADMKFSFNGREWTTYDRPPLILDADYIGAGEPFPIFVINNHLRSLNGIDRADGFARQKRYEQAYELSMFIQDFQTINQDTPFVVTGDFNAFQFTDGYVDVMGQITGVLDPDGALLPGTDEIDPNLFNEVFALPQADRYSFIFGGNAQGFDYMLTAESIAPAVVGVEYPRGNADSPAGLFLADGTPLRASDHDGVVLYVLADTDFDGVPNGVDVCPDTMIPESVPTQRLGTNRWALVDEDGIFDTTPPNGKGNGLDRSFTIEDTAGCSCEQIIDELHLGSGHTKFGCSVGAMETWIGQVQE